jgi:hypothetical protein
MGFQQRIQRTKPIAEMKKGGPIKKTGMYMLHKGEYVMTANQVKSVAKATKK